MKTTIYIALISSLLSLHAQAQTKKHTNKKSVLTMAEHYPEFPGGNDSLHKYIARHIVYPQEAIDSNIQGKVMIRFVVDTEGVVTDAEVVRGIHPQLDTAAIQVVENMPKWKPGEDNGRKVNVYFVLPVTFHLQDDTKKPKKKTTRAPARKPVMKKA